MKKILSRFLVLMLVFICVAGTVNVGASGQYEILVDPGFEENNDYSWIKYVAAYLEFSDDAYEGDYSLLVTDRRHPTDVMRQYVTEQLNFYGPGKYNIEAYVKISEEGDKPVKAQVVLGAYTETEKTWGTSNFVEISKDKWTKISKTVTVKWDGTLKEAEFYIITDENTGTEVSENQDYMFADLLIDSCVLEPVDYKGEVYSTPEPTAKPTATPTVKPTEKPAATPIATATADNNADNSGAAENEGNSENVNNGGAVALSSKQTVLIGVTAIAIGVVLAGCGIALFVAYRKDKKNEKRL